MRNRPLCIACLLTLGTLVAAEMGFVLSASSLKAQEPEAPKPTKEHELFKMDEGVWDANAKFFIPGMDAQESKGEETNRLVAGLWLVSDYKDLSGAFEGHGVFGYDPAKKKYIGTWVDTMSTSFQTMEGSYDAKTKTLTMMTEAKDPATGKPVKQKHVSVFKSDGVREFSIYSPGEDGKEAKILEIVYKRRK